MNRYLGYLIAALIFFSTVFTIAYLFFPEFRAAGLHLFAGVILTQFVGAIVGIAAKEIIKSEKDSIPTKDSVPKGENGS